MLMGFINRKQTFNLQKLNERINLLNNQKSEQRPANFRNGFDKSTAGDRSPDAKRAPVMALDKITNTLADEDSKPLKEEQERIKTEDFLNKPSKGYFDMVFKKRASESVSDN